MSQRQLSLVLPRFKVEYDAELKMPLAGMGLSSIFSDEADFTPAGLGNQRVGKFKHKAKIEVNEEGAEAAAVTAVMLQRSPIAELQINRPFFWAIRDDRSRALIFAGVIVKPD